MLPTPVINRFKALILVLMAMFFMQKFLGGTLNYYIGPRFSWLAIVAVGLFIVLAGSYNLLERRQDAQHADHHHDHASDRQPVWPLLLVAVPLVLGVIIPARPLGATAIASRGVTTDLGLASDRGSNRLSIVPSERNILDWVREMNTDPDALIGQEADVIGFVYREPRFADEQFLIGRFTMTCCVADALAIGLVVEAQDADAYTTDTWVRVHGTFAAGELDGQAIPVLLADEITPVQAPEQPYLYP